MSAASLRAREVRVHASDPDFRVEDCPLKFTLTFEGVLATGGRQAGPKHERRRQFHDQLKRLWAANTLLAKWHLPINQYQTAPAVSVLAKNHASFGTFEFVPLITRELSVEAYLHFHILRPTTFKGQNADSDNIVKSLVHSLKMPQSADELPNDARPQQDEIPFFVLMQDDGLLSKITSIRDELLQPVLGKNQIDRSDTRVTIDVHVRPNFPTNTNLIFFSDNFDVWDHQWTGAFDGIHGWSNSELKARTTQCILRMRVTASNFRMQRTGYYGLRSSITIRRGVSDEEWKKEIDSSRAQSDEQHAIWSGGLRPIAVALMEELQRRIFGEAPYPTDRRMMAIESGMLAGVDPIGEAAVGLESLIRQLPY